MAQVGKRPWPGHSPAAGRPCGRAARAPVRARAVAREAVRTLRELPEASGAGLASGSLQGDAAVLAFRAPRRRSSTRSRRAPRLRRGRMRPRESATKTRPPRRLRWSRKGTSCVTATGRRRTRPHRAKRSKGATSMGSSKRHQVLALAPVRRLCTRPVGSSTWSASDGRHGGGPLVAGFVFKYLEFRDKRTQSSHCHSMRRDCNA